MFVVLFEVQPKEPEWERYLELAKLLRPELEKVRGFLENERYSSERTQGRVLSLSTWADEKALVRWRTHGMHHEVQEQGRFEVFADYHLRVGETVVDTAEPELRQTRLDLSEVSDAPFATVTEVAPDEEWQTREPSSSDFVDAEWFTGINTEGKRLMLASWRSEEAARGWIAAQRDGPRFRLVRVVRDYGMRDREEAPQYYPPVESADQAAAA